MELDLNALRAVAEAATRGPWLHISLRGDMNEVRVNGEKAPIANWQGFNDSDRSGVKHFANARHIATFDPATVLALLDRLEAADLRLAIARSAEVQLSKALSLTPAERDAKVQAALMNDSEQWCEICEVRGHFPGTEACNAGLR